MVFQLNPCATTSSTLIIIIILSSSTLHWGSANGITCCDEPDIQLTVACANGIAQLRWTTSRHASFGFAIRYGCDTNYTIPTCNYTIERWLRWNEANVGTAVPCPSLSKPSNGIINCSLGDDESPSYEDTCGFTCNTGYELTGSSCQSNGSWNGNDAVCNRVPCPSLSKPSNGIINCSLGDDESPSYDDKCSFRCNTGYILNGSESRTCQSDGSWSGSISMCKKIPAPIVSMTATNNYPTNGESFSIECNVTVAKGIVGNVEIIWKVNGTVKRRVTDTVAVIDSQFVLHRDVYSMPPLHTSDNNTVYCCKAVIDAGEQVESNSSITLTIVADVISTKMITVSPTSTNVITLTPDSKHKNCSLDHAAVIISSIAAVIFVMIAAFFIGYCAYKILIRRRNKLNFTRQKDDDTAISTI